jgi:hypothetical protein
MDKEPPFKALFTGLIGKPPIPRANLRIRSRHMEVIFPPARGSQGKAERKEPIPVREAPRNLNFGS